MNSGTVRPFTENGSDSQPEINNNMVLQFCTSNLPTWFRIQQRSPIWLMKRIQQHWKISKQPLHYIMNTALLTQSFNHIKSLRIIGSYESYDIRHLVHASPCSGRCSSGGSVLVDLHDFHRPPGEVVKLLDIWCMFDGLLC